MKLANTLQINKIKTRKTQENLRWNTFTGDEATRGAS
jgi:hypothetical protein